MGVGVVPATEFLKGSGIDVEKNGGIRVDEYLRVRSVGTNDVYAIGRSLAIYDSRLLMLSFPGDIAIYPQIQGEEIRIEHWNVAGNHGRAVGKTISGSPQVFVKIPVFWSACEYNICLLQADYLPWE